MTEIKDDNLGKKMLEVIPQLMHQIRKEIRSVATQSKDFEHRLTVPQFRILANISRGLFLVGQIAEHHGVSQPAMSKMVEGLVKRELIHRQAHPLDQRQVVLSLTEKGKKIFQAVRKKAQVRLNQRYQHLSSQEKKQLIKALKGLKLLCLERENG